MSQPVQIPEDLRKKINNSIFMKGGNSDSEKSYFRQGAEFGYSLSQQQLEEKEKEIESHMERNIELAGYNKALHDKLQEALNQNANAYLQLQSFREKLSNITKDELLKNMNLPVEIFDEHFKAEKKV